MDQAIEQTLVNGANAIVRGQYRDADRHFASVLAKHPNHCEANFHRGVIRADEAKAAEALPFFTAALQSNPDNARYWVGYINALIKLGFVEEADSAVQMIKSKGARDPSFDRLARRIALLTAGSNEFTLSDNPSVGNILDHLKLPQALRRAERNCKLGDVTEALQIYSDILDRFPNNKTATIALKKLAPTPQVQVETPTDPSHQKVQRIVDLLKANVFSDVLDEIKMLQRFHPRSAVLFRLRGTAHAGLDENATAVACYENAMTFDPRCSKACYNLGGVWQRTGEMELAAQSYRRALTLQPDFSEASFQLGNVLQETGEPLSAIDCYVNALQQKPDFDSALYSFGSALRTARFNQSNPEVSDLCVRLLEKGTFARPVDIVAAAISLIQFEPALQIAIGDQKACVLPENLEETINALGQIPLLTKVMALCPVPNLILEGLFTKLRAALLAKHGDIRLSDAGNAFCIALALQCFTNEYIYTETDDERASVCALRTRIAECVARQEQPAPLAIALLACYEPLSVHPWSRDLILPDRFDELLERQVNEQAVQMKMRGQMPQLSNIQDEISARVRTQYEENPYPRWVQCNMPPMAFPLSQVLEYRGLTVECSGFVGSKSPEILIAGCGTGQTTLEMAAQIENCSVQAVDLSLSSLSYAKFKAEELGLDQIDFIQADILDLSALDRSFDVIESTGVLHHMKDPMAGWRVLSDCLKPGGLMKIALYSQTARRSVVAARNEIAKLNIKTNPTEMKQYRQQIANRNDSVASEISNFNDFFALGEFRDLLFHEQEHRFTLPQIQQCLDELDLKFCGFENSAKTKEFHARFDHQDAAYDLAAWHSFETKNPTVFAGMYQFWCQKPV